jgi:hypothetical protein
MYAIKRQQHVDAEWLVTLRPEGWGERDQAMRFETRREAERAAVAIKVSGDWSIEPGVSSPRA